MVIQRNSTTGGARVATHLRSAQDHYQSVEAEPVTRTPFSMFLTNTGDGTGTNFRAIADYSGASADEWYVAPAAGEVMVVTNLRLLIADGSALANSGWGNLAALPNGIEIKQRRTPGSPTDVFDLLAGKGPITTLGALQRHMTIDDNLSGALAWTGSAQASFELNFAQRFGFGLRLVGDDADYIGVTLQDDFTGLVDMTFLVWGYYEVV